MWGVWEVWEVWEVWGVWEVWEVWEEGIGKRELGRGNWEEGILKGDRSLGRLPNAPTPFFNIRLD